MPPIVAIVGRPNVGKSTLFNRLTRGRRAITHDLPGVTRDRLEAPAEIEGRFVTLVDTGGMDYEAEESLARQIVEQAEAVVVGVPGKTVRRGALAGTQAVLQFPSVGQHVAVAVPDQRVQARPVRLQGDLA